MTTPEEYLCTYRPSSFSLASSAWAQTSPSIHPTNTLVCELRQGQGELAQGQGQGGFLRPTPVLVGKEQLASAIIEFKGQELVSGDIFNWSSGKYVIAEAERMPSSGKSTYLKFESGLGDIASPYLEGLQDFFTTCKTRKHNFLIKNESFSAFKLPCLNLPLMGFSCAFDYILDSMELF